VKLSMKQIEHMSDFELDRLLNMIDDFDDTTLTYVAEVIGRREDNPKVIDVLIKLTKHKSALVREGAVYGLSYHPDNGNVVTALKEMLKVETSQGVKEAIEEVLDEV